MINHNQRIKRLFLPGLLLVNIFIFYAVYQAGGRDLKVVFLDIGQGDAIFIESPSGNQVLIDGGPNRKILSALGKVMPFYDRSIDFLVATHPDADHIGGLPSVLENYKVSKFFSNGASVDTAIFKQLESEMVENNLEWEVLLAGDVLDFGDGVFLKIIWPEVISSGKNTNEYSIVAELQYGDDKFLLTGDISSNTEAKILSRYGKELKSDVLKVAHHGSKNSLSPSFLSAVSPDISIISAGLNNRYGHPHKEVVDFLNNLGTVLFGTYESGNISFKSDGQSIERI